MYGESNMETYITKCKIDSQWECCMSQGTQTGALYQPRGVGLGREAGQGREVQEGGDLSIPVADSR